MDTGLTVNNTRTYVNISSLSKQLDSGVCTAIVALDAVTGCDYTAAFIWKGKIRPQKLIILKRPEAIHAFSMLGEEHQLHWRYLEQ